MRSFATSALLLSLVPGSLGQLARWTNLCRNLSKIVAVICNFHPFTPPSEDFCKSNTLDYRTVDLFFMVYDMMSDEFDFPTTRIIASSKNVNSPFSKGAPIQITFPAILMTNLWHS